MASEMRGMRERGESNEKERKEEKKKRRDGTVIRNRRATKSVAKAEKDLVRRYEPGA